MAPFAAPLTGDEMEPPDYYATLRVDRTATPKEIRAAYLGLAAHLHPDKVDLNSVEWLRKEALKLTQDADTNGSSAPETHTPAAAATTVGLRDMRAMADEQFQLIDRAFRVLSDPNKRHAYDAYGANGVRAFEAMSAVGHCDALSAVSSPAQVRELITRLVQQERQQQLEATIGAHGSVVVEATMLPLVDSAGRLRPGRLLPAVTHMVMQQAVDVPLSARTQGTFGGYVVARGGVGMGNASLGLRHALSARSWLSGGAELGFDPQINLTGGHTSSPGGATTTLSTGVGRHGPNLRYSVAFRGGANTAVNASWRVAAAGGRATVHVGQTREGGRSRARLELSLEETLAPAARASYTRAFTQRTRGDVGVRLSAGGWELHANALRSLSPLVHVKVGCKFGVQGVTVVLRFQRGGMRFHLPILLSAACDPLSVLVGAVVPAAVDAAIRAVVAPTLRAEAAESERRVREAARRQRRRGAARAAAAKQVQLMLHAARRKTAQEEASGGLVILAARYGAALHADFGAQWFLQADNGGGGGAAAAAAAAENGEATDAARAALACEPRNIDVTVPLQFFVSRGALSLPAGAKSALLGFYPVTEGLEAEGGEGGGAEEGGETSPPGGGGSVPANLYVRYVHAGRTFEVMTESEVDALQLPSLHARYLGPADVVR